MATLTQSDSSKERSTETVCQSCKQLPRGCALRRGMCRACYLRAWRGTELPTDAKCCSCDEQRRVVLRWTQLGDGRVVTCQNCGFLADKTRPRVKNQRELVERLERERRRLERRRNYVVDPDEAAERRNLARRTLKRARAPVYLKRARAPVYLKRARAPAPV